MEKCVKKMKKWRRHTADFKLQAVQRMKSSANITELARELGVERKLLYVWKNEIEGRGKYGEGGGSLSPVDRKLTQLENELAKTRAALAREVVKNDFFRTALRNLKTSSQNIGSPAPTKPSTRMRNRKAR